MTWGNPSATSRLSLRALLAALLLTLGVSAQARPGAGDVPPDELGLDPKGTAVSVSEYHGKVVAVVFWATWCGRCLEELPVLEQLQRIVGDEHLAVVAINHKESAADVRKARRRMRDYQMRFTHDRHGEIGDRFGVRGIPHLVLIDRAGVIARVHVGYDKETGRQRLVEMLMPLLQEQLAPPAP